MHIPDLEAQYFEKPLDFLCKNMNFSRVKSLQKLGKLALGLVQYWVWK